MKITFVCLGNICRSPMAEYIAKHIVKVNKYKNIDITSAGTSGYHDGEGMHYGTKKILDKYNIDNQGFVSKKIDKSLFDKSDLVIVMDNSNYSNIIKMFGSSNKIIKICEYCETYDEVPDPWYTNNFKEVYDILYESITNLIHSLNLF